MLGGLSRILVKVSRCCEGFGVVGLPSDGEAGVQVAGHRLVVYGACKAAVAF
jgi:hypothetical protein